MRHHRFIRGLALQTVMEVQKGGMPEYPGAAARAKAEEAVQNKAWLVILSHMVDNKGFDEYLKHLDTRRDKLWVGTFGAVGMHCTEREHAKLQVLDRSPGVIRFSLALGPAYAKHLWNQALTVSIPVGISVTQAIVEDAAAPQAAAIARGKAIVADLPPDDQIVTVRYNGPRPETPFLPSNRRVSVHRYLPQRNSA